MGNTLEFTARGPAPSENARNIAVLEKLGPGPEYIDQFEQMAMEDAK